MSVNPTNLRIPPHDHNQVNPQNVPMSLDLDDPNILPPPPPQPVAVSSLDFQFLDNADNYVHTLTELKAPEEAVLSLNTCDSGLSNTVPVADTELHVTKDDSKGREKKTKEKDVVTLIKEIPSVLEKKKVIGTLFREMRWPEGFDEAVSKLFKYDYSSQLAIIRLRNKKYSYPGPNTTKMREELKSTPMYVKMLQYLRLELENWKRETGYSDDKNVPGDEAKSDNNHDDDNDLEEKSTETNKKTKTTQKFLMLKYLFYEIPNIHSSWFDEVASKIGCTRKSVLDARRENQKNAIPDTSNFAALCTTNRQIVRDLMKRINEKPIFTTTVKRQRKLKIPKGKELFGKPKKNLILEEKRRILTSVFKETMPFMYELCPQIAHYLNMHPHTVTIHYTEYLHEKANWRYGAIAKTRLENEICAHMCDIIKKEKKKSTRKSRPLKTSVSTNSKTLQRTCTATSDGGSNTTVVEKHHQVSESSPLLELPAGVKPAHHRYNLRTYSLKNNDDFSTTVKKDITFPSSSSQSSFQSVQVKEEPVDIESMQDIFEYLNNHIPGYDGSWCRYISKRTGVARQTLYQKKYYVETGLRSTSKEYAFKEEKMSESDMSFAKELVQKIRIQPKYPKTKSVDPNGLDSLLYDFGELRETLTHQEKVNIHLLVLRKAMPYGQYWNLKLKKYLGFAHNICKVHRLQVISGKRDIQNLSFTPTEKEDRISNHLSSVIKSWRDKDGNPYDLSKDSEFQKHTVSSPTLSNED